MSKNVLPLFPSSLSFFTIDNVEELDVNKFEFMETVFDDGSCTSIRIDVLDDYPHLKKIIKDNFEKFATETLHYQQNFRITTSWFTKVKPNISTNFHNHKNCFYSGVYYFQDHTEKSGKIEFKNPLMEFSSYHIIPKEYDLHSSSSWSINPQKGLMLFFPSYLYHRVTKHFEDRVRYSLAFNLVPDGNYGMRDSTYVI